MGQALLVVLFVALVAPMIVSAVKKVVHPLVGKKVAKYYNLVNLAIAIYLATAVRASIGEMLGVEWYYASVQIWIVTGFIGSLGSKAVYEGLYKKFSVFRSSDKPAE